MPGEGRKRPNAALARTCRAVPGRQTGRGRENPSESRPFKRSGTLDAWTRPATLVEPATAPSTPCTKEKSRPVCLQSRWRAFPRHCTALRPDAVSHRFVGKRGGGSPDAPPNTTPVLSVSGITTPNTIVAAPRRWAVPLTEGQQQHPSSSSASVPVAVEGAGVLPRRAPPGGHARESGPVATTAEPTTAGLLHKVRTASSVHWERCDQKLGTPTFPHGSPIIPCPQRKHRCTPPCHTPPGRRCPRPGASNGRPSPCSRHAIRPR